MMKKFQLNAMGFNALQQMLYKRSDAGLEKQSQLIMEDFIQWMDDNFELNREQISHLKTIGAEQIAELAAQTAIAVRGRLNITLIKPEIKPVIGYGSKLIQPKSYVRELVSDEDQFEAEGELVIEISY